MSTNAVPLGVQRSIYRWQAPHPFRSAQNSGVALASRHDNKSADGRPTSGDSIALNENTALLTGLNRNKLLTGRGNRWTREHVTALRNARNEIVIGDVHPRAAEAIGGAVGEIKIRSD